MNTQKIILIVFGIAVVVSLGFFTVRSNEKIAPSENIGGNIDTTETPVTSVETIPANPAGSPTSNATAFGKSITLKLHNTATFSDGLKVTLKEINDSRCPKDVQCVWAGELSGTFSLFGGKIAGQKEIRMGSLTGKGFTVDGYVFSLESVTTENITITVSLK